MNNAIDEDGRRISASFQAGLQRLLVHSSEQWPADAEEDGRAEAREATSFGVNLPWLPPAAAPESSGPAAGAKSPLGRHRQ